MVLDVMWYSGWLRRQKLEPESDAALQGGGELNTRCVGSPQHGVNSPECSFIEGSSAFLFIAEKLSQPTSLDS